MELVYVINQETDAITIFMDDRFAIKMTEFEFMDFIERLKNIQTEYSRKLFEKKLKK